MQKIALPKKIEFKKNKEEENRGEVIVNPLYPGYGTTIGNVLRRVLLSSLPGAAPIGVKIKGVSHEFMAQPNIKEDVLELILNIKELKLKVFSEEIVKLELKAHGTKEVKARDIKKNSDVEIINKDLIIGNITDMFGNLEMEIFVKQGMGYEMSENREEKSKEIGYIEIDSVYTPVLSVGIENENVRVGKMTNWDSLILDIKTDGTITPEEAFYKAVDILMEQFGALLKKEEKKKDKKEEKAEKAEKKDKKTK